MGIDLFSTSITNLLLLVIKRIVYLVAKLISFKGLAFTVCCIFLHGGIISGAVWCSLVLGIITNRTGRQIMQKFDKGNEAEENTTETNTRKRRFYL